MTRQRSRRRRRRARGRRRDVQPAGETLGRHRSRAAEALRRQARRRRRATSRSPWRDLRLPRAERRGQDDDGRDPRGLPLARRRRGRGARLRPREATRAWRARIGVVLQTCAVQPELTVGELLRLYGGYYPAPLSVAGDARAGRPERAARPSRRRAVRRTAAPPRRGAGARRRPRAAVPRRADDRLRPLGAPPHLGGDRGPARPRQDRVPDDSLHGRGAGARRPGRGDRAAGGSSRKGRPTSLGGRDRAPTTISFELPAVRRRAARLPGAGRRAPAPRHGDASSCTATSRRGRSRRLTGWAAAREIELVELEVRRPTLEEIYLESDGAVVSGARADRPPASLRPDELLAQPAVRLLHGHPAGDLPVHLRQRVREQNHAGRRPSDQALHLLRAGDHDAGDHVGDVLQPDDLALATARTGHPQAHPQHAAAARGVPGRDGSAPRSRSRCCWSSLLLAIGSSSTACRCRRTRWSPAS